MKQNCFFSPVALMSLALALCIGHASASDIFTYQGKLTDAAGVGLPDGQYRLGMRIWDLASGGTTPLWARKYDVPVVGGLFSLMIGSDGTAWGSPDPLTASLKLAVSGTSRFLEITVMSDANGPEKAAAEWQVLAPRQALNAVPYAMNGCPPGTVLPFAGATAPEGWVLCSGEPALSSTDPRYSALFAAIGTAFNRGGESAGTFRVPDLRGRTAIGAGQGTSLSNRTRGQSPGSETQTLSAVHLPAHTHSGTTDSGNTMSYRAVGNDGSSTSWNHTSGYTPGGGGAIADRTDSNWPLSGHTHNFTTNGGNGLNSTPSAFNLLQPSLVLNYIIKL